jgi:hypothetical protein
MTTPTGHQVPSQATSGYVADTSVEGPATVPAFMRTGAPITDPGQALRDPYAAEINKLHAFLMQAFPSEMTRSNTVAPESPVEVVIRLLQGFGATGAMVRCSAEYCNLPMNHTGDHGFVQYAPR